MPIAKHGKIKILRKPWQIVVVTLMSPDGPSEANDAIHKRALKNIKGWAIRHLKTKKTSTSVPEGATVGLRQSALSLCHTEGDVTLAVVFHIGESSPRVNYAMSEIARLFPRWVEMQLPTLPVSPLSDDAED